MLELNDVTLCAADSVHLPLTMRAMHLSIQKCKFGDAVLFSHERLEGPIRTVEIENLSLAAYQNFRLRKLPKLIESPFVLFVEWDGYVVDPRAWHPSFREYDYIGAKWPQYRDSMTVGNSGFSLHSQKLLRALTDPRFVPIANSAVDTLICRTYRPELERDYGIRFASEQVADLFSYETAMPRQPTFGFHGLGNMWRYVDDAEMIKIATQLNPYVFRGGHFMLLLKAYSSQCKFHMVEQLYALMRKHMDFDEALKCFHLGLDQPHADGIFNLCEYLVSRP